MSSSFINTNPYGIKFEEIDNLQVAVASTILLSILNLAMPFDEKNISSLSNHLHSKYLKCIKLYIT